MNMRSTIFAAALVASMAATAQAGLLTAVLPVQGPYTTPSNGVSPIGNQIIPDTLGWLGADLELTGPAAQYVVTYEFMGNESGWDNIFNAGGGSFTSNSTPIGTKIVTRCAPGILAFDFWSQLDGGAVRRQRGEFRQHAGPRWRGQRQLLPHVQCTGRTDWRVDHR